METYNNLDSYKNKCNHYLQRASNCMKPHAVLESRYYELWRTYHAVPVRCNTLACPLCASIRRARIKKKITHFLQQFPDAHMLTLTIRHGKHELGIIMEYWKRLRARFWKEGIKFKYFLVREFTRKGTEHLHILVSQRLNIVWVRKVWKEITGDSFVVHIAKADEGAVAYLSKYLSKQQEYWRITLVKRMRLYAHSKGLLLGQYCRLTDMLVKICNDKKEAEKIAEERNVESRCFYEQLRQASRSSVLPDRTIPF
jgi:hypothetical protein